VDELIRGLSGNDCCTMGHVDDIVILTSGKLLNIHQTESLKGPKGAIPFWTDFAADYLASDMLDVFWSRN